MIKKREMGFSMIKKRSSERERERDVLSSCLSPCNLS